MSLGMVMIMAVTLSAFAISWIVAWKAGFKVITWSNPGSIDRSFGKWLAARKARRLVAQVRREAAARKDG